jgi:nitroreductase
MRVFDAIYSLRATRIYHDRPVPADVMDQILQAGTMACSSGNTQPWEFVVVTDRELKKAIKTQMVDAFATIDAERAQRPEDLRDGAGRPVTGPTRSRTSTRCPRSSSSAGTRSAACGSRASTSRTRTARCGRCGRSPVAAASASSRRVRT